MAITQIRSRILQYFSKDLLRDLNKICHSVVSDNNLKVDAMIDVMRHHNLDFIELGPGTNRLAILIDNYVFKIALDKRGIQDNINEFTTSQELQPYVVKTYETNDLITVCEYVTVISREEFEENKEPIRRILSILSESYLLGDVGTVGKNFCNWGYRDNGELVILDFAYIYRVKGDELLCSRDKAILEYDENFYNLRCPVCSRKYTFMDIRRRIPVDYEKRENSIAKQLAFKLTKPIQEFSDGYKDEPEKESLYTNKSKKEKEEEIKEAGNMKYYSEDDHITKEEEEESYREALALIMSQSQQQKVLTTEEQSVLESTEKPVNTKIVEFEKETATDRTHIRVVQQNAQTEESHSQQPLQNVATELNEQLSELEETEDEFFDRVADEIRSARPDAVLLVDQDHTVTNAPDGSVTETTKIALTVIDPDDTDRVIDVELEDPDGDLYRNEEECDDTVIVTNTTQLTDNISVKTSVEVHGELAESLRKQLGDQDEYEDDDERRREELEEKYGYLSEDEYSGRKGGRKEWE